MRKEPQIEWLNPVLDAYISALKETYGQESWPEIESFAQRVWDECRVDGDPEWDEIKDVLRERWTQGVSQNAD